MRSICLVVGLAATMAVHAADDRFHKKTADSMMGFMPARDATYVKECGSCHFAYSPGLLPARSWVRHMDGLDKHFGETLQLDAATRSKILDYLTKNAADASPYEGSRVFMELIPATYTPLRFMHIPKFRQMHTVMREIISTKSKVKVRTLTNCNACHTKADEGSFGLEEMYVPGLTGP
jgi:cytochrome c553